nr:hypothetical protein [Leptolyngbya sp. Prado105]
MSEYQYYEFQALDRPLSSEDQEYIRTLSSRVEPTATRAKFVYHYGNFRGDPLKVLDRCFDMMMYIANFGVRRLMIRFPKNLIDPTLWKPYCVEGAIELKQTKFYDETVAPLVSRALKQMYDLLSEKISYLRKN